MAKDFRGRASRIKGKANFEKVARYFTLYPEGTTKGCMEMFKLSYPTVAKHRNAFFESKEG